MKFATITIAAFVFALSFLSSCKRGDDLYINPNNPAVASPATLLASIEVQTFNTYEGDLTRNGEMLIQHMVGADGQATQVQVYSLNENQFDNQWQQVYQTLNNGQTMLNSFGAGRPYYSGITRVLMALNWGMLADMWGDIPYTQALKAQANYQPAYDPQQTVYAGIISMLDQAIADLSKETNSNLSFPGGDDFVFGGDPGLWLSTAHTLKARYLNRYSNKPNYSPTQILDELTQGIASSSDNAMAIHGESGNEENQWYAYLNQRAYIVAASTLVDSMLRRPTDERLYYYYDSTGLGGVIGSPIDETDPEVSYWGSYLAAASSTPTPLVTYTEAKFLEAEVRFRSGDQSGAATALNDAIVASATEVTGGAYTGSELAIYDASTVTLERVMYEKWIAMFGQAEGYTDYRRTKLPVLTPNPKAQLNSIPERYPTPQSERVNNPKAPIPALSLPTWFAL
jgi:hypothetical protein